MEHIKTHLTPILTPTPGWDWCCFVLVNLPDLIILWGERKQKGKELKKLKMWSIIYYEEHSTNIFV